MNSSFSQHGEAPTIAEETSLPHLLAYGVHCFRQGRYIESISYFTLVREKLPPDQTQLAAALDSLKRSHISYSHAQKELLLTCKRFASTDAEQQAQLAALENLVSTLEIKTNTLSDTTVRIQRNSGGIQSSTPGESLRADFNREKQVALLAQRKSEDISERQPLFSSQPHLEERETFPALYATCFGRFQVTRSGKSLELCSSRSGQTILRYLIAHTEHRATKDTLMALLWPEKEPEIAQSKLHIAISALRRSLNCGYTYQAGCGYIICRNQVYSLNTAVVVRTDVEEFLQCYQAGQLTRIERIALYERACGLYAGPFLPEDMYADWSFLQREQLRQTYITMCRVLADHYLKIKHYEKAAKWAIAALAEDHCDEESHRQLIQVYITQGRRSEAIQQYHYCERVLREELGMQPLPETTRVFQAMLTGEHLAGDEARI